MYFEKQRSSKRLKLKSTTTLPHTSAPSNNIPPPKSNYYSFTASSWLSCVYKQVLNSMLPLLFTDWPTLYDLLTFT